PRSRIPSLSLSLSLSFQIQNPSAGRVRGTAVPSPRPEKRYGGGSRPPAPAGMALGVVLGLARGGGARPPPWREPRRRCPASAARSGRTPASCICRIRVERPLASFVGRIHPSSDDDERCEPSASRTGAAAVCFSVSLFARSVTPVDASTAHCDVRSGDGGWWSTSGRQQRKRMASNEGSTTSSMSRAAW
ncbi:unnamed protein product, partial [Urochloa humidicola]